jgi:hypothetical protein
VQFSDAIFRGVVVAVEPETERPGDIYDLSVVVLPSAWWKGQAVGSLRLLTPASPALCGVRMDVGHEYLVFAYRYVDTLAADLCTRTHETYEEDPDMSALGPPQTVPASSGSWGRVKALYR